MAEEGVKACRCVVPDDQLSLAIGKEGQNARLAARLTGYKIDIKPQSYQPGEDDDFLGGESAPDPEEGETPAIPASPEASEISEAPEASETSETSEAPEE